MATIGGGGAQNADIQLVINGPDLRKLEASPQIAERARSIQGASDVDTSLNSGKPEVSVVLDRAKAADWACRYCRCRRGLATARRGREVATDYNEGGEQYQVFLRARPEDRTSELTVAGATVPSSKIGSVPLENLASLARGDAPSEVNRLNRQRQVTVYAASCQASRRAPSWRPWKTRSGN